MSSSAPFAVNLDALAVEAGAKVWQRGQAYAREGRIEIVASSPTRVTAQAHGTDTYTTVIESQGGGFEMACSCPAFADYPGPCKHLAALAITLASPEGRRSVAESTSTQARLRRHLDAQPHERLVDLILDVAETQPLLKQRLELQARTAEASPTELAGILKKAIAAATRTGGFVDYRRMADWAARVDAAIDQLNDSLRAGPAAARAVLDLIPYLVERLEKAVDNCDDDGHIGLLLDRCTTLLEAAAKAVGPDGEAFARLLLRLDLDTEYFDMDDPARRFAVVLGAEGLQVYWRSIEAEWAALKPVRPHDKRSEADDGRRFRLTRRRLARTEATGDIDAQIETLSRTLVWPGDFIRIARLCEENGRIDQAVPWIDEALWLFEDHPTPDLIRSAAEILGAAGQHDRALDLLWGQFTRVPSLETYRFLTAAAAAGTEGDWSNRAIDWLEALRVGRSPQARQPEVYGRSAQARAANALVAIYLDGGNLDTAWTVAGTDALSSATWEMLARASEAARPADAADIYERLAEQAVQTTNRQGYRQACGLVLKVQALRKTAGRPDRFRSWLDSLRTTYKPKRTFIALLKETVPE
ncbi:MAG: SWIM zinc finger family protein [Alphaproteobacteria bacterium]|nr:SWIM zinc finger family protein [Alphaproteobacteria bacterium]